MTGQLLYRLIVGEWELTVQLSVARGSPRVTEIEEAIAITDGSVLWREDEIGSILDQIGGMEAIEEAVRSSRPLG